MQLLSFPVIYDCRRRMLTHILSPPPHERRQFCELLEAQRAPQHIHAACGTRGAPAPIISASAAAALASEKKNQQALIFL